MKTFVQENLREHPELQEYKDAVEGLNRLLENMAFSARSKQTTMLDHFPVVREEGGEGRGQQGGLKWPGCPARYSEHALNS